jgi:hypothetical protein
VISTERLEEMRHLAEQHQRYVARFTGMDRIKARAAEEVEVLTELIECRRTHEALVRSTRIQRYTSGEVLEA